MKKIFMVLVLIVLLTNTACSAVATSTLDQSDCESIKTNTYLNKKGGLGEQFEDFHQNSAIAGNKGDAGTVSENYKKMLLIIEKMEALEPPRLYESYHQLYLGYQQAIANATKAISEGDKATTKAEVSKANDFTQKARTEQMRITSLCYPDLLIVETPSTTAMATEMPLPTETPLPQPTTMPKPTEVMTPLPTLKPADCPSKDEDNNYENVTLPILNNFESLFLSLAKDVSAGNHANLEEYKKHLDEDISAMATITPPEAYRKHHEFLIQEMYLTKGVMIAFQNGDEAVANAKAARVLFLDNHRRLEASNISVSCGV